MSSERGIWRSGEVLAYTEREGPGRPPAASPTWMIGTLVGVLGVTFAGLLSSDTLCPDHRLWVQVLATVGFVAMGGALVGLVRGWAAAPLLTLVASSLGVAIGLIDAVHSATRGRFIAVGFGVAFALAAIATARAVRLRRWDRRTTSGPGSDGLDGSAATTATADAPGAPAGGTVAEAVDDPAGVHADR